MKNLGLASRAQIPALSPTKPDWQCRAWGCTLAGTIGLFGTAECLFHHGKEKACFDAISDLVNREAWRMRLVRCAQNGNADWREDCRTLARKYGRPELDPIMLGMGLVDSTKYEILVHRDMADVLREPIAKAVRNVPVTISADGEVDMTPLQMIARWRAEKTGKALA